MNVKRNAYDVRYTPNGKRVRPSNKLYKVQLFFFSISGNRNIFCVCVFKYVCLRY